jgi:hypothetical protein
MWVTSIPDGSAQVINGDAKAAADVYQLVKGDGAGVFQAAGQGIVRHPDSLGGGFDCAALQMDHTIKQTGKMLVLGSVV